VGEHQCQSDHEPADERRGNRVEADHAEEVCQPDANRCDEHSHQIHGVFEQGMTGGHGVLVTHRSFSGTIETPMRAASTTA
jgi:hypothetical protein